jgi:N-acetylglutamate synthase-like GNAT family acetyltransferase
MAATIRAARRRETDAVADLLRRAGFGSTVGRLLEYPSESPHGEVLVAERRDTLIGTASVASFGATGWIGALGVEPNGRRRGLGTALTEACVDWLRERGARTVLLYATEAGRPVYERLGFVAEGTATAWRGVAGARDGVVLRVLHEDDRDALAYADRAATGEDRSSVLGALRPLRGVCAHDDAGLRGFAVSSVWGSGACVVGDDEATGLALMAAAAGGPQPATLIVPDTNPAAAAAVRRWGFARYNTAERMRLGPDPGYARERVFGMFNLFWG